MIRQKGTLLYKRNEQPIASHVAKFWGMPMPLILPRQPCDPWGSRDKADG